MRKGPGRAKRVTRGELISAQVTSLLEKEVGRKMIEVFSLAMPTEVWMGADNFVAPVFFIGRETMLVSASFKTKGYGSSHSQ